jgi:hypothetical protein
LVVEAGRFERRINGTDLSPFAAIDVQDVGVPVTRIALEEQTLLRSQPGSNRIKLRFAGAP